MVLLGYWGTAESLSFPKVEAIQDKDKCTCSICLSRSEDCRHYPSNIAGMIRDESKMIEKISKTRSQNWIIKCKIVGQDREQS